MPFADQGQHAAGVGPIRSRQVRKQRPDSLADGLQRHTVGPHRPLDRLQLLFRGPAFLQPLEVQSADLSDGRLNLLGGNGQLVGDLLEMGGAVVANRLGQLERTERKQRQQG